VPENLPRTLTVLEDTRGHLAATSAFNTEIDTYLARGIAITLCAEIEYAVTTLIGKRTDRSLDLEAAAFVRTMTKNVVRNATAGEIGDVLSKFGAVCRGRYDREINRTIGQAGRGRVGELVAARDSFGHLIPPQVTFRDMDLAYEAAVGLVTAVEVALGESYP
jgi:hypothetical protein